MNKKFEGIYLFSDIDDTFSTTKDVIPAKNLEAIKYFTENGGNFAVATARFLGNLKVLENINVNSYSILANGSCVYNFETKEFLIENTIPKDFPDIAMEFCHQNPDVALMAVTAEGYFNIDVDGTSRPIFHQKFPLVNMNQMKPPFIKLQFSTYNNEDTHRIYEKLLSLNFNDVDFLITGSLSIEVVAKNINKGQTFLKLCEILNIPREKTFFTGDNYNDMQIMEHAGFSGCPIESPQPVKEYADIVLGKFDDGILYEMVKIIEEKISK